MSNDARASPHSCAVSEVGNAQRSKKRGLSSLNDVIHASELPVVPRDMQESERNRLLRRADWRFLLHNPRPSKTIRYCDGTLRQAMEVLSPVMVTGDDDPRVSRNCDLAVVTDPNVATLRGAWSALRPGGSLYVEGHEFHSATRSWLRRQLRRSGFCEVRCFWPYPNPETFGTTWWVPLDNRAVLRYVLRQHLAMGEIEFRLQGVARRFLSGTFARPTPWPVCAVARNPIAAGAAPRGRERRIGR